MLRALTISRCKPALRVRSWLVALKQRATSKTSTMTTLKRTDSKVSKAPPLRSCVACTENEESVRLVKPCRRCNTDYCVECLLEMFRSATADMTRMPPHCCALLQIHTIIGYLTDTEVKQYRAKFEEFITPVKTYCPSPTCSAFISPQRVPTGSPTEIPSLKSVLSDILTKVSASSCARFFRGEMDISVLAGFTNVVQNHIDLGMIQDKIDRYRSTNDVTIDMRLLVSNAKEYNGEGHPVTIAANELFSKYLQEISHVTDRLIAAKPPGPLLFACPECHIAICSDCKQVEHMHNPCDLSSSDHETAMLATFGYKRCPRCQAGVKKMYGCSHMQCICGAHWCYWCQRSTTECDGRCDPGDDSDDEEGDYDSEEDELSDDHDAAGVCESQAQPQSSGVGIPNAQRDLAPIVNLDAGGGRRWAARELNLGEEPDDEPFSQIWSCTHNFKVHETPPNDGYNRGDLERMECNRCFENVRSQKVEPPVASFSKKRHKNAARSEGVTRTDQQTVSIDDVNENTAVECSKCRLLVCIKCREKYIRAQQS